MTRLKSWVIFVFGCAENRAVEGNRRAQRKIPVVLHPVHQNPRFHGQKSILLLFIHEMPCFRGQELHKDGWLYLPAAVPCKSFLISIIIREYAGFSGWVSPNCTFRPENTPFSRTENCSSFIARRQWVARFIDVVCQFCCESTSFFCWFVFARCGTPKFLSEFSFVIRKYTSLSG